MEIQTTGWIDESGRLSLYMGEANKMFKDNKGCRVYATFKLHQPKTTQSLRGYYFQVVVPLFRNALWQTGDRRTLEQTEDFLRSISPIMYEEVVKDCKYMHRIRRISEISNSELYEHIETLKQIAAEEFNLYIEDPRRL